MKGPRFTGKHLAWDTLVALLLLIGRAAHGDEARYVSPSGNDGWDGTSATFVGGAVGPWQTINQANKLAANGGAPQPNTTNGDVTVYVDRGNYAHFPNPASVPANGKRYRFIAKEFAGTWAAVSYDSLTSLPAARLSKTYLTVRGFKINGGVTVDSGAIAAPNVGAVFDSLDHCLVLGGLSDFGSDYCTIAFNLFRASNGSIRSLKDTPYGTTTVKSNNLTIAYNITAPGFGSTLGDGGRFHIGARAGSPDGATVYHFSDSLLVERNQFNFDVPLAAQPDILSLYYCRNPRFLYNDWQATKHGDEYEIVLKVRTNSSNVLFNGDRFIARGPGGPEGSGFRWSQAGDGWSQVRNVTMDSLVVQADDGCPLELSGGMRFFTITNSVFVTGSGPAFTISDSVVGANTVDHCTFVSANAPGGVVNFYNVEGRWHGSTTLTFKNNILALVKPWPPRPFMACDNAPVALLRLNKPAQFNGKIVSNNNLFASFSYSDTLKPAPGQNGAGNDRAITWFDENVTGGEVCSQPGDNSRWERLHVPSENDSLSKWGGAEFAFGGVDTIPGADFDARIGGGSVARGIGTSATDAGAIAFVAKPKSVISASELRFSDVPPGATVELTITISNTGTGDLVISSVTSSSTQVTVSPASATIAEANSQVFTVTYTKPASPGIGDTSADIIFNHPTTTPPFTFARVVLDPWLNPGDENPN